MARFACATWRPISHNIGGTLSPSLGLVLHHQAGNGSLVSYFNNPATKASAHFWVSKSGQIEQMVDTGQVAWHGRAALNPRYAGVETEGCPGGRDEPLTDAQVDALARLYAEGHRVHGWPNALASAPGQKGFGYHRMGVATSCPCEVRLKMRPEILRRAFASAAAPAAPPVPVTGVPPLHVDYLGRGHNDRHPDVKVWQQKMRDRGWSSIGAADGIFGPKSEAAARAFQQEKGLTADGKVGPRTWAATWTAPVT